MEQMIGDLFNTHGLNSNDRSFATSVLPEPLKCWPRLEEMCNTGNKDKCVFVCVVCTVEFYLWSVRCSCCRASWVCQVLACHKLWNWWDSICLQRIGRCLRWEMGWPGSLKVSKRRKVWVYGKPQAATQRWSESNHVSCWGIIIHDFTSLGLISHVNVHISKENEFWSSLERVTVSGAEFLWTELICADCHQRR